MTFKLSRPKLLLRAQSDDSSVLVYLLTSRGRDLGDVSFSSSMLSSFSYLLSHFDFMNESYYSYYTFASLLTATSHEASNPWSFLVILLSAMPRGISSASTLLFYVSLQSERVVTSRCTFLLLASYWLRYWMFIVILCVVLFGCR